MPDETSPRPPEAPDGGGHRRGGGGECSPLQTRAPFLANWNWELVVGINRRACARGGAQHGINSEAGGACGEGWERDRPKELTLNETFDLLRHFHRAAPFLFFNGNTFASIGRELALALFHELPAIRRREASSAVAHYIAGVLPREAMVEIVESLCRSADLAPGDRVCTLKGTLRGVIVRILDDGRVAWRPDGSSNDLIALPESLSAENS